MKKTFYLFRFIAIFSLVALVSCEDGAGDPGPAGFVSLVKPTALDIGDENCPNGWTERKLNALRRFSGTL